MQVRSLLIIVVVNVILLLPLVFAGMSSYRPVRSYKCIRVLDGDTIILQKDEVRIRVRFANIDAPEISQFAISGEPVGLWSKNFLERLVLDKAVRFKSLSTDIYGREIGIIYLKGVNINLKMVRAGHAVYYQYKTSNYYRSSQSQAKIKRLGLWQTKGIIAPWEYRRRSK